VKTDMTKWPVLSTVSVATLKQLHTDLAAVGLPVLGAEATATLEFGTETGDRVRDFQKLHGLPAPGTVDPTTCDVMTPTATPAMSSHKNKLQAGFRACVYESEMHWDECV
jgi:murein L,D-transpeptidase YcbB/YkuD